MRRAFYPVQTTTYDLFCTSSDIMSLSTLRNNNYQFSTFNTTSNSSNWQTNPPPYPFKIIDDNTGFWRNVIEQGIEDYALGSPIIITPSSPIYEYYSKWRLCREGECVSN